MTIAQERSDGCPVEIFLVVGQFLPIRVLCRIKMFHLPMETSREKFERFLGRSGFNAGLSVGMVNRIVLRSQVHNCRMTSLG